MGLVVAFLAFPALVVLAAFVSLRKITMARITSDLLDPATRQRGMQRLERWLERQEATGELKRTYAPDLVNLSATLLQIGEARFAAAWLDKLDPTWMVPEVAKAAANNEALAWLDAGDVPAARRALKKATSRGISAMDDLLDTTEALVLTFEARHREALAKIEAVTLRSNEPADVILEVRARAHAGGGDTERAIALLRESTQAGSTAVLESMVKRGGPGASLAKQLLESRGSPYR